MRTANSIQLLAGFVLLGCCIAVALVHRSPSTAVAGPELRSQSQATQEIASEVALAMDRGEAGSLEGVLSDILSRRPNVTAVEVVGEDGHQLLQVGLVESLQTKAASDSPDVRRVALLREGRTWGEVRILFKPAIRSLIPGDRNYWAAVALAVLVLPLTIALIERVRRRLDRSPEGPMAVAADRARHTLDTLAEGVLLLDADGKVAFANHAFCEAAGSTLPALTGQRASELSWATTAGTDSRLELPWESVLARQDTVRGVRLGLRRAGYSLIFSVNCTPLFRKRGVLHGVLATFDDVTELEHHRIATQDARDDAQRANEAKSRFLAMMSHEIRTPLNGVCGSLQLLKKTPTQPRQSQYIDAAAFSASTLLHLINDILDLSKIEAGQMELSPMEFDVEDCIDRIMLMMAQPAQAKNLCLAYHIEAAVASRLVGDPDRIRQIVINLTNNAIKFTERGSVSLRISLQAESADRQTLKCDVEDTGIGIPGHKMHRLFKAFSQVDSSTTRRYGGTGLGLVISKQLCELMGGRIDVASVEGSGATFTFLLDLQRAKPSELEKSHYAASPCARRQAVLIGLHPLEVQTASAALQLAESDMLVFNDLDALDAELTRGVGDGESEAVAIVAVSTFADLSAAAARIRAAWGRSDIQVMGAIYGHDVQANADPTTACSVIHRPIGLKRLQAMLMSDRGASGTPDAAVAAMDAKPQAGLDQGLAGLKILLAEDNTVGQMVVSDMIRNAGATCDVVGDGKEVLEAVERQTYDLILMDCFMPDVDGFAATRQIREWQQQGKLRPRLPIIALTAKAMRGDREDCMEAGMDGYVSKPVDESELLQAVAQHAGRPAERGEPATRASASGGVDVAKLHERYSGKPELLRKLVDAFKTMSSEDLARIEKAIQQSNAGEVEQAAHRMAGGAGFVSAHAVRQLAADIEHRACEDHLDEVDTLLKKLRQEVELALGELDRCIAAGVKPVSIPNVLEKEVSQ